jgi:uridine kinase
VCYGPGAKWSLRSWWESQAEPRLGKTTVARKVHEALETSGVSFIDQDSYYRDLGHLTPEERREINFDHPDAFDTELLVTHLKR